MTTESSPLLLLRGAQLLPLHCEGDVRTYSEARQLSVEPGTGLPLHASQDAELGATRKTAVARETTDDE